MNWIAALGLFWYFVTVALASAAFPAIAYERNRLAVLFVVAAAVSASLLFGWSAGR